MKIVLALHGWPAASMGGTGLYVGALRDALRAEGHRVFVLAPGEAGPLSLSERDDVARLCAPTPTRFEHTWRRREVDGLLAGWLRRRAPDVLHIHHLSGLSLGLIRTARNLGIRVVLTLHDYALPCARGQLVDRSLAPCPGPTPPRCAACLSEHLRLDPISGAIGGLLGRWPALRGAARQQVGALSPPRFAQARIRDRSVSVGAALAAVDVLLSPSADLAERLAALRLPRPSVFPLPLIRPVPSAPPAQPGPVRFLFASSVIPTKGPHLLLAAFSRLPAGSATLSIVGPTPPFDGAPGYAEQLAGSAAAVPGASLWPAVPPEAVPDLLADHDVLVLPSLWPENSPLVIREAAAAGLPVIASAMGGAGELVPDAVCVPPGDLDALTEALRAEVAAGRRRLPPAQWPSPQAHARRLVAEVYRGRGANPPVLG